MRERPGGPPGRLRRTVAPLILAATLSLSSACAGTGGTGGDSPFQGGARSDRTIRITIENRNFKDATVWALWNGNRVRVGRVTGNTTDTFRIQYRNGEVRFEVDFLAGGGYTGRRIPVSPGEHLDLTIRPTG